MEFLYEFAKSLIVKILMLFASIPLIIWWLAPCLLAFVLFRTAISKRKSAKDFRTTPKSTSLRRGELSQEDKQQLAEKIRENSRANMKKSFAAQGNIGFIVGTIAMILLTVLFFLLAMSERLRR